MAGQTASLNKLPTVDRVVQRYGRVKEAIARLEKYPADDQNAQAKLADLKVELADLEGKVQALRNTLQALELA